ncbi:MAG TPA: YggT family protein [Candidatus Ozemobacteraceae bacterium]|nr:YggT family protein [Candidatus Ozemobacteraceae bacterium]
MLLIGLVLWALRLLQLAIFLRVMLTWIAPDPSAARAFSRFTDPMDRLLKPFSVAVPMGPAYLDLGPMLALFLIEGISRVLIHLV